jgi:hypothetical protein
MIILEGSATHPNEATTPPPDRPQPEPPSLGTHANARGSQGPTPIWGHIGDTHQICYVSFQRKTPPLGPLRKGRCQAAFVVVDGNVEGVGRGGSWRRDRFQAAIVAVWSLSRLWVAAISRRSARQAANPRLWNRRIPRLNLVFAKTVSIMCWRLV